MVGRGGLPGAGPARRLAARGEIASPAREFDAIVPPEYRRPGRLPADQFIPAPKVRRNVYCYVGLLSAVQHHGAAPHAPQELQAELGRNRPSIACGSSEVTFVARRSVAAVPVQHCNHPRWTPPVSTMAAMAVDLVGYVHRASGVNRVAGVLSRLHAGMDPERLVGASRTASIVPAQHPGYLLECVNAGDKAALRTEHVHQHARNFTKLPTGARADGEARSQDWRLYINARIEPEA